MAEWDATFGRLYRRAIDAGVLSIMSAHIALPAFVRSQLLDAGVEAFRPASVNRLLNIELLRRHAEVMLTLFERFYRDIVDGGARRLANC